MKHVAVPLDFHYSLPALPALPALGYKLTLFSIGFLMMMAFFVFPELAHAAGANPAADGAKTVMEDVVKYLVWFGYLLIGISFIVAAWWIIQAGFAWKDPNNREGTVGNILLTVFVAIAVIGILFFLITTGQKYIEDNVKFTLNDPAPIITTHPISVA